MTCTSSRLSRLATALLACGSIVVAAWPATAEAQRTRVTGGQFRDQTVEDTTLNRKGRIELALDLAGAMSFGSSTPEGGDSVSQSNIYVTPSLVGGYMLTDNIEVRLSLGYQYLSRSLGEDSTLTNQAFVGAVQGLYQRDLILGLAIYGGLGAGGFVGSRTVPAGMLEERLSTSGGLGQVLFGLLMMPGPRLLLRGGLRADILFGSETPDNAMSMLPESSFFTTQILFEVAFGFRFG